MAFIIRYRECSIGYGRAQMDNYQGESEMKYRPDCPKCGSDDVFVKEGSVPSDWEVREDIVVRVLYCKKCGHVKHF